jgi:hypothetical protein
MVLGWVQIRAERLHPATSNPATKEAVLAISDTTMARGSPSMAIQAISGVSAKITSASRAKTLGQ